MSDKLHKSDADWQAELTAEQYRVTRQAGTEAPFSGQYYDHREKGQYLCICCGTPLFKSDDKFDAGCGWPSFYQALNENAVNEHFDDSLGMRRIEITCKRCDSHLGHVFEDGPKTFAVICISNRDEIVFGQSATLPLPVSVYQKLLDGYELGTAMDELFNTQNIKQKGGAIGQLTMGLETRKSIYVSATILTLSSFMHESLYP